jgi:hypothetical protein
MIRFQRPECYSAAKGWLLVLMTFAILSTNLSAWTNGSLLIWMDNDRGHALEPFARKFEFQVVTEKLKNSSPSLWRLLSGSPDALIQLPGKVCAQDRSST